MLNPLKRSSLLIDIKNQRNNGAILFPFRVNSIPFFFGVLREKWHFYGVLFLFFWVCLEDLLCVTYKVVTSTLRPWLDIWILEVDYAPHNLLVKIFICNSRCSQSGADPSRGRVGEVNKLFKNFKIPLYFFFKNYVYFIYCTPKFFKNFF